MQIGFIPVGNRKEVEVLLRDMEAQKHLLPMTNGKKKQLMPIPGVVRQLPFGVYEYICPKEDADSVFHTLNFESKSHYLSKVKIAAIRSMFGYKKIPKYKKETYYRWIKENVAIIPLGFKEDTMRTEDEGIYKGWTFEAL